MWKGIKQNGETAFDPANTKLKDAEMTRMSRINEPAEDFGGENNKLTEFMAPHGGNGNGQQQSFESVGMSEAAQTGATALTAIEPMNHPLLLSVICANLAEVHAGLSQFEVAEASVMRALGAEEIRFRSVALTALAIIRRGQGRPIESRAALLEALDAAIEVRDQFAEAAARRLLADD